MSQTVIKYLFENHVEDCKKWLLDTSEINFLRGLSKVLFNLDLLGPFKEDQAKHIQTKLMGDKKFVGMLVTADSGIIFVDGVATLEANPHEPILSQYYVRSRPKFVKLMYQYISYFPDAFFKAYEDVTGEELILDGLSDVRTFYESITLFDSWTGHQLCSYISHCDPEALDFFPETSTQLPADRLCLIFSRKDLYEKNVQLVKAAILGGAFELIHHDQNNCLNSSLRPKAGIEWAKSKCIDYHPLLNEHFLKQQVSPIKSSGYTTPYLQMMQEVINELEISKESQGKKEAIAALFAKKLNDHKMTPPSQKLADAMATLVRLPESQQGRARRKG